MPLDVKRRPPVYLLLENQGLNAARGAGQLPFFGLFAAVEAVVQLLSRSVKHDGGRSAVLRPEGTGLDKVLSYSIRSRGDHASDELEPDPDGTWPDVAAEVSQVVIGALVGKGSRFGIDQDWGVAVILRVVGAALLVKSQVPVDPALAALIEVVDDIVGVALSREPRAWTLPSFDASLGQEKVLVWIGLADLAHVFVVCARIPVVGDAVDVLRSSGDLERVLGPVHEPVAIVIPYEDLKVAQAVFFQFWAEKAGGEFTFFRSGPDA